jgi:hypothetical protein
MSSPRGGRNPRNGRVSGFQSETQRENFMIARARFCDGPNREMPRCTALNRASGLKRADGPERVFGEWWKGDAELVAVRDYFQVEDDGGERFWIYRTGDGEDAATGSQRWFIHGIFA